MPASCIRCGLGYRKHRSVEALNGRTKRICADGEDYRSASRRISNSHTGAEVLVMDALIKGATGKPLPANITRMPAFVSLAQKVQIMKKKVTGT